jgi:hypothetical protein
MAALRKLSIESILWVPETLRTFVDLLVRRRLWSSMIIRWR